MSGSNSVFVHLRSQEKFVPLCKRSSDCFASALQKPKQLRQDKKKWRVVCAHSPKLLLIQEAFKGSSPKADHSKASYLSRAAQWHRLHLCQMEGTGFHMNQHVPMSTAGPDVILLSLEEDAAGRAMARKAPVTGRRGGNRGRANERASERTSELRRRGRRSGAGSAYLHLPSSGAGVQLDDSSSPPPPPHGGKTRRGERRTVRGGGSGKETSRPSRSSHKSGVDH